MKAASRKCVMMALFPCPTRKGSASVRIADFDVVIVPLSLAEGTPTVVPGPTLQSQGHWYQAATPTKSWVARSDLIAIFAAANQPSRLAKLTPLVDHELAQATPWNAKAASLLEKRRSGVRTVWCLPARKVGRAVQGSYRLFRGRLRRERP